MPTRNQHGQLLRLVPSVRWDLTLAIGAGLAAGLLLIVQTLLLTWVVRDVLFHHEALGDVTPLLILTASTMVARAAVIGLKEIAARRGAIRVKADLRQRLSEHLLRLGPGYLTGERTGDLIAMATAGIDKLDPYVSRYLPQMALSAAVPLMIVLAILPVDPLSAVLLVFTVPMIIMLMILIGTFTRDHVQGQ